MEAKDFDEINTIWRTYSENIAEAKKNIALMKEQTKQIEDNKFKEILNLFQQIEEINRRSNISAEKISFILPFNCDRDKNGITKVSVYRDEGYLCCGLYIQENYSAKDLHDFHSKGEGIYFRGVMKSNGSYRNTLATVFNAKRFFGPLFNCWEEYEPIIMASFKEALQFNLEEQLNQINKEAEDVSRNLREAQEEQARYEKKKAVRMKGGDIHGSR